MDTAAFPAGSPLPSPQQELLLGGCEGTRSLEGSLSPFARLQQQLCNVINIGRRAGKVLFRAI